MDIFIARQPVFDAKNRTIGYELLFRSGNNNIYDSKDGDNATLDVLKNSFYILGIDKVIEGKKAFINFTEKLLKEDILSVLPPDKVIVEILEDINPSEEIVSICKNLKKKGYLLALDDFIFHPNYKDILKYIDIIKVDFRITKGIERKNIIKRINSSKIKFLAEKVETVEEFNEAISYGYSYFQGYYFSKPIIMADKDIPKNKYTSLKILNYLNEGNVDFDKLEKLILGDVSISYKVLKLMNSSAFGFKGKISSVKQAISLIGETEARKWLYIVLMADISNDKPTEVLIYALVRAKFSEIIANTLGNNHNSYYAYLTGMFSLLDTILDKPLEEILSEMYIPNEVKGALLREKNYLKDILDLTISYEKCQWDDVIVNSNRLGIECGEVTNAYIQSVKWVRDDMNLI